MIRELHLMDGEKIIATGSGEDFVRLAFQSPDGTQTFSVFLTDEELWSLSQLCKLAYFDLTGQDIVVAEAGVR